jgi:AraC family transcriptional regulator of adaptative response/methylated-DNA-[protein]-cysteine methyltransferase
MKIESASMRDYNRIEQALTFVAENFRQQPSLAQIAESVHLSEHHFQRLFQRWAGVSPKQFLQYLTVQQASECLQSGLSTMETAYEVGLSAPARLGELFVRLQAVTPGEYKSGGVGIKVVYGVHDSPFGECLLGVTDRGVCGLQFLTEDSTRESALAALRQRLPHADYRPDPEQTVRVCNQIFSGDGDDPLPLLVSGTAFQLKVWEALLRIPAGGLSSYGQIAKTIGKPAAVRAVGTAVGQNPVALLIPCHRVIRRDGMLGGYRWGVGRKLALQGWEKSRLQ